MKVIAVNGSHRKTHNTAKLLRSALDGAMSGGADIDLVNLADLNYNGCISCFGCKKKNTQYINNCACEDELTPVLNKIVKSDAVIMGSPIYFGEVTAIMRSFLERLIFMNSSYEKQPSSVFSGKINIGFIYTMNTPKEKAKRYSYIYQSNNRLLKLFGGQTEHLICADTCQFDDYSKYNFGKFDGNHKAKIRETHFPEDLTKAYKMGQKLAEG